MNNNISTYYGKNKQKNKNNNSSPRQEPINLFDSQKQNNKENKNSNFKNNSNYNSNSRYNKNSYKNSNNNSNKFNNKNNNLGINKDSNSRFNDLGEKLKIDINNISPEERRRRADLEFKKNKKPKKPILTEEQKLEQEYENRIFYENLMKGIIKDDVEKKRKFFYENELKRFKEEDETVKRIIAEERWSFLDKSLIQQKKLSLRRKKLSLVKIEDILPKIKDKKFKNFYFNKIEKNNSIKKFVYYRRHFLNIKKLFSISSKELNYKGSKYFSTYQLFKVLPIDKILYIKNKLNNLRSNYLIQNFNLFSLKLILNHIPNDFFKKNLLNRTIINSYFLYLQKKYIHRIKNVYNNILNLTKKIYLNRFTNTLTNLETFKKMDFNSFKIFPISFFYNNNVDKDLSLYSLYEVQSGLSFKKNLKKIIGKISLSKKDLFKYYRYRKKIYSLFRRRNRVIRLNFYSRFNNFFDIYKRLKNSNKIQNNKNLNIKPKISNKKILILIKISLILFLIE